MIDLQIDQDKAFESYMYIANLLSDTDFTGDQLLYVYGQVWREVTDKYFDYLAEQAGAKDDNKAMLKTFLMGFNPSERAKHD